MTSHIHHAEVWSASSVSTVPCCLCKGPVIEFSVPNEVWNRIVRGGGPETDQEYLCVGCFAQKCIDYAWESGK